MSEVNTNTAAVSEPISSGGGEAPVSWDQLESVSNYKAESAKLEAKEEIKAEKEAKKELGVKESGKEAKESKATEKAAKSSEEKSKEAKAEIKRLKLKHADQELDIPLDIQVPVKVDGKTENVTLQEALSRYSQQKHLDKLYQDYKKDKSSFDSERTKMNQTLERVSDLLVNKKDIRGFIELVAEPLGLDPSQVYQDMREKLESQFEEAQALSPEERKAKSLEEELSYYRTKQEAARQQKLQEQEMQTLESKVQTVLESSKMDKASFVKAYDELVSLGFKAEDLSPEQIGAYYRNMQTITLIEQRLGEKNPELAKDPKTIERLSELAIQTKATPEEIEAVIEELYSSDADRKLAKKINKSLAKAASQTPVKNPGKDPMFFDDIV